MAFGLYACVAAMGNAQTNRLEPAEFTAREYVDSRGCQFLRATFGGQVTWVPRYGPDRRPVCTDAVRPATAPERAVPIAEIGAAIAAPSVSEYSTPRAQRSPRRSAPKADRSGRHASCPASAPFGQLVDTTLGRPLVRCVTSPSLFLDPIHNGTSYDPHAPIALPDGGQQRHGQGAQAHSSGNRVQVASFAKPANAKRLRARLQNAGLPVQVHTVRGYNVVTLGPFISATEAHAALGSVRGMGFSDAFIRR